MVLYLRPDLQLASRWLAMLASFIPYGVVAWLMAAVLFVTLGRRRLKVLALPALVALAFQVAWTQPYWPHAAPAASGDRLRVMSLNMKYGKADPDQVTAEINREQPGRAGPHRGQHPPESRATRSGCSRRLHQQGRERGARLRRGGRREPDRHPTSCPGRDSPQLERLDTERANTSFGCSVPARRTSPSWPSTRRM